MLTRFKHSHSRIQATIANKLLVEHIKADLKENRDRLQRTCANGIFKSPEDFAQQLRVNHQLPAWTDKQRVDPFITLVESLNLFAH
jgi:hypothetical protein